MSSLVHQHPAPFVLDSSFIRPAGSFYFNLEERKSSPATIKEEI